jgi:hypothetical protein
LLLALSFGFRAASASGIDDPFYDWGLEAYRCLRPVDAPSGAILPLPDTTAVAGMHAELRSAGGGIDLADVTDRVPVEEGSGIRVADGARGRAQASGLLAFPMGFGIDLAGRFTVGEGRTSGGDWLERSLFRAGERTEVRLGLTRAFWGEGNEGSLLLGRTAPPMETLRLRSVRPWRLPFAGEHGRLHASFFLAYLDERDRTIPYPLLHGERLEWEPLGWARLAASRTILFGGAGRTERFRLRDVWNLLAARNENVKGPRGYADSDQKVSFTAELRLPGSLRPFHGIDGGRVFYEYGGEDAFHGLLPSATARVIGASMVSRGWAGLVEYAETVDDANQWYTHTIYGPDAYFYHGYCLGHPMGTDGRSRHVRIWTPEWRRGRAQIWWRLRGHGHEAWQEQHGGDGRGESFREESAGLRVRRDFNRWGLVELGFEAGRETGKARPRPETPVRWQATATVRLHGFDVTLR